MYGGKTSELGRSFDIPLIGYVYAMDRRHIKDAIKRTWSNAGVEVLPITNNYVFVVDLLIRATVYVLPTEAQ